MHLVSFFPSIRYIYSNNSNPKPVTGSVDILLRPMAILENSNTRAEAPPNYFPLISVSPSMFPSILPPANLLSKPHPLLNICGVDLYLDHSKKVSSDGYMSSSPLQISPPSDSIGGGTRWCRKRWLRPPRLAKRKSRIHGRCYGVSISTYQFLVNLVTRPDGHSMTSQAHFSLVV
jgi:hypothetical protein